MEEKKVFINDEGIAVVTCPECNTSKNMDARKYRKLNKAVRAKVKCKCGNVFPVLLERRKYFRKSVNLQGKYIIPGEKSSGTMKVEDLSRTGLHFKVNLPPRFKVDDKIVVEFHLDDKKNTFISKQAVIRTISGMNIGAEFNTVSSSDIEYDKAIGFYMMYN
ncbi:PilZ domain-containing protein [Desulfonema limicola]|uniref:PilZ domain-containing protein n=1 Tax=Desulfonema limicola TaxID=45656 RepID=A0A975BED2_9BACT|nr:PilZ domain-containing protein [Desulfonema limicola]QTA83735.1 PilZ domain-containing protein [Desulfonema limicola]